MFLLLSTLAFAEDLWASSAADGVRWPDVAAVSVQLSPGDKVEVMSRQGDKVRVRKGTDFGWVVSSALTDVEPVAAPVGDLGDLPIPSFTIPGAEEKPVAP